MSESYDVIVLGAGIMGSAAAYHAAKAGQRVLLLEQFEIDHQHGSSYGHSRIIRYVYDHPAYVELAKAAYPLWASVEAESGEKLYTRTGGLDFGRADDPGLKSITAALTQCGIPYEILPVAEVRQRYPQFRFDDDMTILYQADTGILSASKCVRTHVQLAQRYGAIVVTNTPVTKIVPLQTGVRIETASAVYQAAKLIITAGAWAKSVLAQTGVNVPLTPQQCHEIYFNTAHPEDFMPDRFPAFIGHLTGLYDRMPYGMASNEDSGLKTAFHGGRPFNHPSELDYKPDQAEIDRTLQYLKQFIPDVTDLRSTRVCLYTMTPDEHFLIDKHPEYPHIVFGAGFSGHGFKFGTLVGRILSDLALQGHTPHDIGLFRLARFYPSPA